MALLRGILDVLFPPACQVCRTPGPDVLCRACTDRFRLIRPPVCDRCGRPLRGPPDLLFTCVKCRGRRLGFAHARAAGVYEGTLRDAVHALKFRGRMTLGAPLGRVMADAAGAAPALEGCDAIVPVPLHPSRRTERGFNQAEVLAQEVAAALGLSLAPDALKRVRATRAQSELQLDERRTNVRGAFAAAAGGFQKVLLIDDVLSTGFTARECARALRAAGARKVVVLALARTVLE
ncbi:MAG: ComF family protein [bacterium]